MQRLQPPIGQNTKWNYVAFAIWPFWGFILAWFKTNQLANRIIILGYSFLYGATYVIQDKGEDMFRYLERYHQAQSERFLDPITILIQFFSGNSENSDLFFYVYANILAMLGASDAIFIGGWAVLFSWMLLKIINFIQQNIISDTLKNESQLITLLFIGFLLVLLPLSLINHFRWYFALLVYVYSALNIFKGRKIFYLLSLSSVLIHFSYILPVLLLLGLPFVYKFKKTILLIATASFFVTATNFTLFTDYAILGGSAVEKRAEIYTSERNIEQKAEGMFARIPILVFTPIFTKILFIAAIVFLQSRIELKDQIVYKLLILALLVLITTNFFSSLVFLSERLDRMFLVLMTIFLAMYSPKINRIGVIPTSILILLLGANFMVTSRQLIASTSVTMLSPSITLFLPEARAYSLLDLYKLN